MTKKFDVVIGNPPFQMIKGNSKIGIGTTMIKAFFEMVKDDGFYAMVSTTTFLGGGQKGLGHLFSENKVIQIRLNHKNYFQKIGVDIGSFIIQKCLPIKNTIELENQGDIVIIDPRSFVYNKTKRYIPRNINNQSLPILLKIIQYNTDIFDFRASASKGSKNKVGFWTAANTGVHPRYIKITNCGEIECPHPCKLDKEYPEENIKSIFAGKIFHWVIMVVNGNQSDGRPANLSFFPKVDLNKKWTFDELGNELKLKDEEKKVILDWALTKTNVEWFD